MLDDELLGVPDVMGASSVLAYCLETMSRVVWFGCTGECRGYLVSLGITICLPVLWVSNVPCVVKPGYLSILQKGCDKREERINIRQMKPCSPEVDPPGYMLRSKMRVCHLCTPSPCNHLSSMKDRETVTGPDTGDGSIDGDDQERTEGIETVKASSRRQDPRLIVSE
jgi:hypothetical protein